MNFKKLIFEIQTLIFYIYCSEKFLLGKEMKKGIHPGNYRPVVFKDMSMDYAFIVRSTAETSDSIEWEDGNTYPLVKLEISDKSHPFFTGKQKMLDSAGRVERFNKKYAKK